MLQRITLHLARCQEFPDGSALHGYEIIAPLDASGHIDHEEWMKQRDRCRVRRFRPDEPDRIGRLVRRPGGIDGTTWLIDYDPNISTDDEAGFRLDRHLFKIGEYISIREDDGKLHTFQVARVAKA